MYSGGCVSACPLRWHSLHLIWSCFSWGHVVHCTFVLCVHIEYKIVKQEACLVGNYLLKCRFCFQRAYIVLLLHNPAILEKGTCDRICVSGFGTKTFPSIFMQHNLFYFWKSTECWASELISVIVSKVGRQWLLVFFISERKWYSF